jgi:hypothetical protein
MRHQLRIVRAGAKEDDCHSTNAVEGCRIKIAGGLWQAEIRTA